MLTMYRRIHILTKERSLRLDPGKSKDQWSPNIVTKIHAQSVQYEYHKYTFQSMSLQIDDLTWIWLDVFIYFVNVCTVDEQSHWWRHVELTSAETARLWHGVNG